MVVGKYTDRGYNLPLLVSQQQYNAKIIEDVIILPFL